MCKDHYHLHECGHITFLGIHPCPLAKSGSLCAVPITQDHSSAATDSDLMKGLNDRGRAKNLPLLDDVFETQYHSNAATALATMDPQHMHLRDPSMVASNNLEVNSSSTTHLPINPNASAIDPDVFAGLPPKFLTDFLGDLPTEDRTDLPEDLFTDFPDVNFLTDIDIHLHRTYKPEYMAPPARVQLTKVVGECETCQRERRMPGTGELTFPERQAKRCLTEDLLRACMYESIRKGYEAWVVEKKRLAEEKEKEKTESGVHERPGVMSFEGFVRQLDEADKVRGQGRSGGMEGATESGTSASGANGGHDPLYENLFGPSK
ncbi:hypothetical protein MMC13_007131 [Lambiella insularis]|nr:hypothetical protein [Lambiella insularis]